MWNTIAINPLVNQYMGVVDNLAMVCYLGYYVPNSGCGLRASFLARGSYEQIQERWKETWK